MSDRIINQKWLIHNLVGFHVEAPKEVPLLLPGPPDAIISARRFLMIVNFGEGVLWLLTGDENIVAEQFNSYPVFPDEKAVVDVGSIPNGPTHLSLVSDKAINVWLDQGVGE